MKKFIAALIALIVVGGAAFALYRERLEVAYRADRLLLEWQAAKLAEAALRRAPSPTQWDAAVFLSGDGLQKLIGGLNGLTLSLQGDDLSLKLRDISVKTMPAFLDIQFELQASSPKRNADLTLKVESELVYVGYEESKPGSGVLQFRMIPLDIVPSIAWAGFDFRGGRLASELLTTGLLPKVLSAAPLTVPLQQSLQAEFGGKSTATVDLNKGLGSTLTYELAVPKTEVSWTVGSFAPLITAKGMWLVASSEKDASPKPPVPEGSSPNSLTHELDSIRSTLLRLDTPAADIAVWLSSKPLLSILKRFADQPEGQRTVSIQSTKITGRIAEDNWSDDLLGKGGTFAEFVDDRSLSGQVVVGNIRSSWVPKQGLSVDLDAGAHADAKVHVHVDPLIGGGVGTTFGLVGDAVAHPGIDLKVESASLNGTKVIVVRPAARCGQLDLDLETDGKAKTDFGWTKVPSIGVVRHQPLALSGPKPIVILDGLPFVIDGRDSEGLPRKFAAGERTVAIEPAWRYLSATVSPVGIDATDAGWMITASLTVAGSDRPDELSRTTSAREALRAAASDLAAPQACSGDSTTEVKLGPFVIGPNNEIVKFFVGIGKFTKEMADRIGHEVSTEKLKGWIADPAGSFSRSDPGRAVDTVIKTITAPVDNYCAHNWCP
jgi:hypothetical protein